MNTRAIILAGGEGTRWNNYLKTEKHLVWIEGERLLDRTVRLLEERGVKDIYIVVKQKTRRYDVDGAELYIARNETNTDADKFLSSKDLWNYDGRTLVLYGDVYFTDDAIETIVEYKDREWTLFCRPNGSKITGSKWGECFVQSFYPEHIPQHEANLYYIADLKNRGVITRCGGWEHYRAMLGREGKAVRHPHTMGTNYIEINDFTEDFDCPEDYENWKRQRALL